MMRRKIDYMGHSVGQFGITPPHENIKYRVTNSTGDYLHKFRRGDNLLRIVQQMKDITGADLIFAVPDPTLNYVLSTGALQAALGDLLFIKNVTKFPREVFYNGARSVSNCVWSISTLRPYIFGRDLRIETGHCPLCHLDIDCFF